MAEELIVEVDPQRWADWLDKGRRLDRLAAHQMRLTAITVVLLGLGVEVYFLMGR